MFLLITTNAEFNVRCSCVDFNWQDEEKRMREKGRERERRRANGRKIEKPREKKESAAKGAEPGKGKGSSTWGNRGWGPDHNITEEPAE